jgi:hypothetical protein
MIQQARGEGLMIFWHAELVGWIVRRKQSAEKTKEFASKNETYIANLHGSIRAPWSWSPQGMSV